MRGLLVDIVNGIVNRYPPCCVLAYCWVTRRREDPQAAVRLGIRHPATPRAHVPCGVLHAPHHVWCGPALGWQIATARFYDYKTYLALLEEEELV